VVFFLVKQVSRLRATEQPEAKLPEEKPEDVRLLTEIRDLLAKNASSQTKEGA